MNREKQIEDSFIKKLIELKYTYREDIRDRDTLERNFRSKFETLNRVRLSDSEFSRLLEEIIDSDVFTSSKRLRGINTFMREDGTPLQYTLVNIKDWCKNDYEVINQLRINTNNSHHRYDVILLVNGIPVAQVELKASDVSPRRAMQQIVDYKNDAGNGYTNTLLCFMQLFIVSNQVNTYYFTNNNNHHFSFNADEQFLPVYQYATESNRKITHLDAFSTAFLSKCILGEMINRYMVLVVSEQKLLIMRPYQIYAVKAIVDCIHQNRGNGYVWHTTGSGKTLTSFKASTLLKDNPDIDKCLFVVDRKDLDRQTREEFNKFQENCVEENTNTETLVKRMLSDDYADKVIVTTIQKLGIALDPSNKNNYQDRLIHLRNKRIVFIFDECHRSQFGENHKAIKEFFPNSQLFGFTGTPIFPTNATYTKIDGEEASYKITEDIFQKELHAYTITHAIEDKNVLRFHVDYFKPKETGDRRADGTLKKQAVVDAILSKHDAATHSRRFNSVLATASINEAIEYYELFRRVQQEKHLPALYVDAQTKTPAFVFALVALIDFISRWFYQDQINKALQRLTMLTELSGISLPELLTEPVNEETNANEPEPITENEPVRAYTPELLYIDQPLVFPVPIFIHKHERTISPTVVPELLNRQCITLLFVSMMLPELLRRYVWGAIRPKANADELFWGDFRRFHTKGNHRIRDGTKEANKPKLQPFQTNYYIHQESLWKRINKPKEVIAETNRLRKVRSMLLDWILIWLILSESNRT
ncbi:type I restriction endonuclease subunit R [Bacteroides fragilis]